MSASDDIVLQAVVYQDWTSCNVLALILWSQFDILNTPRQQQHVRFWGREYLSCVSQGSNSCWTDSEVVCSADHPMCFLVTHPFLVLMWMMIIPPSSTSADDCSGELTQTSFQGRILSVWRKRRVSSSEGSATHVAEIHCSFVYYSLSDCLQPN